MVGLPAHGGCELLGGMVRWSILGTFAKSEI